MPPPESFQISIRGATRPYRVNGLMPYKQSILVSNELDRISSGVIGDGIEFDHGKTERITVGPDQLQASPSERCKVAVENGHVVIATDSEKFTICAVAVVRPPTKFLGAAVDIDAEFTGDPAALAAAPPQVFFRLFEEVKMHVRDSNGWTFYTSSLTFQPKKEDLIFVNGKWSYTLREDYKVEPHVDQSRSVFHGQGAWPAMTDAIAAIPFDWYPTVDHRFEGYGTELRSASTLSNDKFASSLALLTPLAKMGDRWALGVKVSKQTGAVTLTSLTYTMPPPDVSTRVLSLTRIDYDKVTKTMTEQCPIQASTLASWL